MRKSVRILLGLGMAVATLCVLQKGWTQTQNEPSLINLLRVEKGQAHPITLEEIIALREITELQLSPDGQMIAFIIKQAFLELNDYRSALFVVPIANDREPVKLVEEKNLSRIRWMPDGEFITYLSSRSGSAQIWRVSRRGGPPESVWRHGTGVLQYEWSRDGQKIAFLASKAIAAEEKARAEAQGIIYNDEIFSHRNLINNTWLTQPMQLWLYEVTQKQEQKLWESDPTTRPTISRIVWSPDGQKIAVEYTPSGKPQDMFNTDIGIIHVSRGEFVPLVTWKGRDYQVCWAPDGQSLAFVSQGAIDPQAQFYDRQVSIFAYKLGDGQPRAVTGSLHVYSIANIGWSKREESIWFEQDDGRHSALYKVPAKGGVVRKMYPGTDHLSAFSINGKETVAACIRQNPMSPPEVAVLNLNSGAPTTLTRLNPEYQNIALGEVVERRWQNKFGYETNGFLIKPLHYQAGRRYPLLLILYGFSGKFIGQAQWMTSYPAQAFAAEGFTVLLMNYPWELGWHYGDFQRAALSQGYNPLASIEKAVQTLVESGWADPKRKGIMGWSFGSFLTEFTISHSDLFEVASAGEGGLNNPGQYWLLGSAAMRYYLEGLFGGPPYGDSYKNYESFSPSLNAHRVHIPVLREYGSEVGFQSFEFYSALRRYGVPVEQVFYPRETHVFSQPLHRFHSMRRNLDWFRFWLLGKEDSDPAKREQYQRWRAMKAALQN